MKKIITASLALIICFVLFAFATLNVSASSVGLVDCLVCNPGEDSSTSLRFTWNSSEPKSAFYYTVESDTSFKNATAVVLDGVFDNTTFPNMDSDAETVVSFYNYNYALENLTPGTTYLYKVKAGGTFSKVHHATTAKLDGTFSFIWISDTHAHLSIPKRHTWAEALVNAANEQAGGAPLIISTGDSVAYGSYYSDWLSWSDDEVKSNYIWACTAGNHDYYCRTTGSSVMWNKSPVGYKSIYWEANNNPPENGLSDYESNFYFMYNSVLFISLDSILQSSGGKNKEIQAWFESVMEKMEGKYQYIVVYQHYPMFDGEMADSEKYGRCGYDTWYKIFDKYGVDLVLSGDSHVYLRSKVLKNKQPDPTGTLFVNAPQIGDRYRYIEGNKNPNLIEFRYSSYSSSQGTSYNPQEYLKDNSGLTYFQVTPEGITGKLIDTTFNVKDEYTITPHRELPDYIKGKSANEEQELLDSCAFIANADGSNEYLYFDGSRVPYVKDLEVSVDGKKFTLDASSNKINLGNLASNKGYEITITATFISGREVTKKVYGSTYANYGVIDGFKVGKEGNVAKFSWHSELQNNVISKFEVYHGDELLAESNTNSALASVSPVIGEEYRLVAKTSAGEIIYETKGVYLIMGDTNDDGLVNSSDCESIADASFAGEISTLSSLCSDVNLDDAIDYKDYMMIWAYLKGTRESLDNSTQKVVFRDVNGNAFATQLVLTGEDAIAPSAPSVEGYTFLGWSTTFTKVTKDTNVYAVYAQN